MRLGNNRGIAYGSTEIDVDIDSGDGPLIYILFFALAFDPGVFTARRRGPVRGRVPPRRS